MKKEVILKILTVIIIGIMLGTVATNVFAATGTSDFWDGAQVEDNRTGNEEQEPVIPENTANENEPVANTNNNNTNNYNTNIPDAGLAENTVVGVAVISLAIVAIFTYNKINHYKNI